MSPASSAGERFAASSCASRFWIRAERWCSSATNSGTWSESATPWRAASGLPHAGELGLEHGDILLALPQLGLELGAHVTDHHLERLLAEHVRLQWSTSAASTSPLLWYAVTEQTALPRSRWRAQQ